MRFLKVLSLLAVLSFVSVESSWAYMDGEDDTGDAADSMTLGGSNSKARLARFRVAQFTLLQADGNSFSGIVSWNPYYQLTKKIALGGYGGFSLAAGGGATFPIVDFGVSGRYSLDGPISLELQTGFQSWVEDSGSSTNYRVGVAGLYALSQPALGFIDNIFVSYGLILISSATTHDLRVGMGLGF